MPDKPSLTKENLRRHNEETKDGARIRAILVLVFVDGKICSVICSFLFGDDVSQAKTVTQSGTKSVSTKLWGSKKFTAEHFKSEDMEALQVGDWFQKAWEQPKSMQKEESETTVIPEPKLKMDGIPSWEWSMEELEALGKKSSHYKKFDHLYTAKKEARMRLYRLLEANGVPRRLKYRIGIGAYWHGKVVRTNDSCYVTFEDCDESDLVCERLVANGVKTQANLVRISYDIGPSKGRKAY